MRSMSSPASSKGIAAIVGVGPKLGLSVARKFAHEGYTVAILARDLAKLSRFADEIAREAKAQVFAIRIDCSDSKSVREAFEGVLSLGFVEVLVYNACEPASCRPAVFSAVSLESLERSLAVSAVGAFHCSQQVIPGMVEKGRGTIIFTGSSASLNGFAGYCELSCAKFALRGLSQCLAREFQSSGVHIAHVIIDVQQVIAWGSQHGCVDGSGCIGTDLLAPSHPRQERVDPGDRSAALEPHGFGQQRFSMARGKIPLFSMSATADSLNLPGSWVVGPWRVINCSLLRT